MRDELALILRARAKSDKESLVERRRTLRLAERLEWLAERELKDAALAAS